MRTVLKLKTTMGPELHLLVELKKYDDGGSMINVDGYPLRVRQARQLAKWLVKAADIQARDNFRFNYKIKSYKKKKNKPKPNPDFVLKGQIHFPFDPHAEILNG